MDDLKITISSPPQIAKQVHEQIQQGWFPDVNSLVVEALRRYLETRTSETTEQFTHQEVEWGLSGEE